MTGTDDDNNPVQDDTPVWGEFPWRRAEEQADREHWPWLPGVIVSRGGGTSESSA